MQSAVLVVGGARVRPVRVGACWNPLWGYR